MISTNCILAIDLGKFNSVFCWYEVSTKSTTFRTVPTNEAEFREALLRQPDSTVIVEACSPAGWVHDLAVSLHFQVLVANTNAEAWAWKNVKRKTDRDDALKLAKLAAMDELPTVPMQPQPLRQRKSLIGLRKRLVSERTRGQNRIRGLLVSQGLACPRGNRAWTMLGLEGLGRLAKPFGECAVEELWRGELDLLLARYRTTVEQIITIEKKLDAINASDAAMTILETVPGVGPRTAEVIVTALGDPKRFRHGDEVSAYAGLVPKQYQSGETDRRGRITRRGPKLLRSALVECAWCSLRYNAWAKATWARLVANGVSKKKAIVALARKLLVRCWAMLKRGEVWKEPAAPLAATPASG
ncbi:MAG: IS110 family transposase [Gemmataceae bacterium]